MKLRHFVGVGIVLAATMATANQDGVLLRRKLEPNVETKYKMETKTKQTVTMPNGSTMPDVDVNVSMDYAVKTGKAVVDKKIPVEISITNYDLQTSMPATGEIPKDMKVTAMLDELNVMSELKVAGNDPKAKQLAESSTKMMQTQFGFPEKAVKPGDTWAVTLPANPMMGKEISITMKFEGERTVEGTSYWIVTAKQNVPVEMDLGALTQGGQGEMKMKGTIDLDMEILYEKSGLLYSMLSNMKTDMDVDAGPQGKIHVNGDVVAKMNRA